jgi:large subunit ribosomal protein L10
MNREEKSAAIQEIAAQIEASEAIFAVDYRGISVPQAAELRSKLREADASFRIVKNRLTKIAADQVGEERLPELLQGPTALTFVRGDTAQAAKAITTFNREHEVLTYKGGFMDGTSLDEGAFRYDLVADRRRSRIVATRGRGRGGRRGCSGGGES